MLIEHIVSDVSGSSTGDPVEFLGPDVPEILTEEAWFISRRGMDDLLAQTRFLRSCFEDKEEWERGTIVGGMLFEA